MGEYIKREDALSGCKQWLEPKEHDELDTMWNHGIEACLNEIKHHVPIADVVEIIRCKDCKKYMTIHCTCDGCCISDEWYCADGERKE